MAALMNLNQTLFWENATSEQSNIVTLSTKEYASITRTGSHEDVLIKHHRDLIDWRSQNPGLNNGRDFFDRPLMGIAIIGGLFLTISLLLLIAIVVFYLKRNTVFVLEKSVHGGLYTPGDHSTIIGQTTTARQLGLHFSHFKREHGSNSFNESIDEEGSGDEDDSDEELQDIVHDDPFSSKLAQHHNSLSGSYMVRTDHFMFMNPQHYQHAPNCTYINKKQQQIIQQNAHGNPRNRGCSHQKSGTLNSGSLHNQLACGRITQNGTIYNRNANTAATTNDQIAHGHEHSSRMNRLPVQNLSSTDCAPNLCSQAEQIKLQSSVNKEQQQPHKHTASQSSFPVVSSPFHSLSDETVQKFFRLREQKASLIENLAHHLDQPPPPQQQQQQQKNNDKVDQRGSNAGGIRDGGGGRGGGGGGDDEQ